MKRVLIILLAINLICFVSASDFTPQGDINLRGAYSVKNATNITSTLYCNATVCYGLGQLFLGDYNSSWNQSLENTFNVNSSNFWDSLDSVSDILGSLINNNLNWINETQGNIVFNQTQTILDNNASWLSTFNSTYDSLETNNNSFNETYTNGIYILQSNESNLNVNSSNFWDNFNTANSTWFSNNGGIMTLIESKFSSLFDTLFGAKDTDDLSQGSTNFYDNRSFNETYTGTLYPEIKWGYNQTIPANTYTDGEIDSINTTTNIENLGFTQGAHIGNNGITLVEANITDLFHTTDTSASVNCSANEYFDGGGVCVVADSTGTCGAGAVCEGGHTHPASEVTAGSFGTGSYVMDTDLTVERIKLEADSTNHLIYDNATCIIITGDTSTLEIC